MSAGSNYWMNYVVDLAGSAPAPAKRVAAALVSEEGELVCSAFEGEQPGKSWRRVLQEKTGVRGIRQAHSLYLTINTLSADGSFDLARLQKDMAVGEIYIGLPDPLLATYRIDDPVANGDRIYRLPDDLQREILNQNISHYGDSEQSIRCNTHYSAYRIGEAVRSSLSCHGLAVSKSEVNDHRKVAALASLIREKHGVSSEEALSAIRESLSDAFDTKYGSYNDMCDARSAHPDWVKDVTEAYERISPAPLRTLSILNVGVGSGSEAALLFADCEEITFVDIARRGLGKIAELIPSAKTLVASADHLPEIQDDRHDVYISLRTFNSSFFDTSAAAAEAHRVLRRGGLIIVSVANGFLHTGRNNVVVPGLILPGTEFVDLYRGMGTARNVREQLDQAGFKDIRMTPASTEILLSGVAD